MNESVPHSLPLPPSLSSGIEALSPEARKRITQLSKPDPVRFILKLMECWILIALAITAATHFHNLWVSILAILVIAGRQNTFALLLHEQTHYLGIKSRWGDLIANFFAVYPLLIISIPGYAGIHLAHHKFYFTEKDPDIHRKIGKHWVFPMKPHRLAILFLKDFFCINLIYNIAAKNKKAHTLQITRMGPSYGWLKPVYLGAWAVFFTVTHSWDIFLIYWLLPLVTIMQVFIRLGAICEHVYIPGAPLESSTAVIMPTWWEGLIFPHLNFFYHIYHHYFPGVPYSRLPEVHEIFVKEGLVKEHHVFNSILEYIKFLLSKEKIQESLA